MTRTPETPLPSPKECRRLREAQSLSQADVAAALGVTRATVRSWENGRTTPRGTNRDAYVRLLTGAEEVTPHQENPAPALVGAATGPVQTSPDRAEPAPEPPSGTPPASERAPKPDPELGPDPARAPKPDPELGPDPARGPKPALDPELSPEAELEPLSPSLTPDQAFDALYAFCAPALVRQTYLLTGRRELARESVERAFQLAWHRWPEVAMDRDPAGWVRATAYEFALSPWHRLRPRHRNPEPPPAAPADRALLDVLLQLPPVYRRTLLLYDGVGLDLPETAAETEASTPAAANRLLHAREAVATRLPELAEPKELHRRLAEVASAERLRAAKPTTVRWGGEQRARQWTRAAIAFTVVLIGATTLTLRTAPDHYEPPLAPGATVHGVPPRVAPGPLSAEELALRAKLKGETVSGPERLVPEAG
ncbi:helix-turn-helix domain-containing protein [Streptomyces mirabilis]|uniref:helix-turn-helix domain-containing protein n=1 Tax=Streptomyces mirabilis TaxID=68239 RepID=UPI00167E1E3B|nr:helix-turn-helix domain-containing protein [Streptomyces mirabilis]